MHIPSENKYFSPKESRGNVAEARKVVSTCLVFKIAGQYISSIDGYIRHTLQKCIEADHKYLLLVEWKTIEAHTVGFRESAVYKDWKALLHNYYDPFPVVEHYRKIV